MVEKEFISKHNLDIRHSAVWEELTLAEIMLNLQARIQKLTKSKTLTLAGKIVAFS